MRMAKQDVRVGMRLEGGHCPVTQLVGPRRDRIVKGMFLTHTPREVLPAHYGGDSADAGNASTGVGASSPAALNARLDVVQEKIAALTAFLRTAKRS